MTKILIKKILNKEKVSKAGKPYKACSILTTDKNGQEVWLNSFANSTTESWKAGQTVDLEIEKTEYGLKFKEPVERSVLGEIDKLNAKIDLILSNLTKGTTLSTSAIKAPQNAKSSVIDGTGEVSLEEVEKAFGEDPGTPCSDIPDFLQ